MTKSEIEKFFSDDEKNNTQLITDEEEWEEDFEGQLSIDMYDVGKDLIIKAPVAGVKKEDLEVSVTEDMISIRGHRKKETEEKGDDFYVHECYWGSFSRTETLPVQVQPEKADASIKDGLLTVKVPKTNKSKEKLLKIKAE